MPDPVLPAGFVADKAVTTPSGFMPDSPIKTSAKPSTNTGLAGALGAALVPYVETLANSVGNSATLPKTASAIARGLTTGGTLIHGMATGNLSEALSSPVAGWVAGKGGYRLARDIIQPAARGVASAASGVGPYVKGALGTLSGVQTGLDLAQMADPNRRDIGTLGIGASQPTPTDEEAKAASDASLARMASDDKAKQEAWNAMIANLHPAVAMEMFGTMRAAIEKAFKKSGLIK